MRTVWVLGDQLNRSIGALAEADLATDRVLMLSDGPAVRERAVEVRRLLDAGAL
jgi:deoxyribodipyrimidine photolyase-related protein